MWWLHFMSARVGSPVRLGRGLWRGGSGLLPLCHCPHCCDKNAWQKQPGRGRLYSGSWFQRVQFMYWSIGSCQREPKGERLHPWPPGSREKWSRRREPGPPTPIGLSKFWSHLWIKPLGQSSHAIISARSSADTRSSALLSFVGESHPVTLTTRTIARCTGSGDLVVRALFTLVPKDALAHKIETEVVRFLLVPACSVFSNISHDKTTDNECQPKQTEATWRKNF